MRRSTGYSGIPLSGPSISIQRFAYVDNSTKAAELGQSTVSWAQGFPVGNGSSKGGGSFAAIPFRQHVVALPEGPIQVGIGPQASIESQDDTTPLGWREAQ
jgi:hypothetical protein